MIYYARRDIRFKEASMRWGIHWKLEDLGAGYVLQVARRTLHYQSDKKCTGERAAAAVRS